MKVVDSKKLDRAMLNTADAIREKTGGAYEIAWDIDQGFSDAIRRISGSTTSLGDISSRLVLDLTFLARWHKFNYYSTIETAFIDIETDATGTNVTEDTDNAEVGVYISGGKTYIVLLKDCTIESKITITKNVCITMEGHTLVSTDTKVFEIQAEEVVIDGRVEGSKIEIVGDESKTEVVAVDIISGVCLINGLTINGTNFTNGADANSVPSGIIVVGSGAKLDIQNAKLYSNNPTTGAITTILINEGAILNCYNCIIESKCKLGFAFGIYGSGRVELSNCSIRGMSDHTGNKAGNNYGRTSRAIYFTAGSIRLISCYAYGTHSGMVIKGDIIAEDCLFESYSHGGMYISAPNSNIFLKDSIIQQCVMLEGYEADNVAGTNNAGIYIGGASNVNLYVDNCKFYGKQQPIVLRGSSGESNNHLYISNSCINLDYLNYGIRNDGSNQTHFGIGNNFDSTNMRYNRNWEYTGLNYREVMKFDTETWEFELTDGSRVTKEVVIK